MEGSFLNWLHRNQKKLITGLAVLFIAFFIVAGLFFWQSRREEKGILALDGAKGEIQKLETVLEGYPFTKAYRLALWGLAKEYLNKGDLEKSFEYYEKLYQKGNTALLRVAALYGMASVSAKQKDYAKTADYYWRASQEPNNIVVPESKLLAARFFEKAGNTTRAIEIYDVLSQDDKVSGSLKKEALDRKLWLAVQEK